MRALVLVLIGICFSLVVLGDSDRLSRIRPGMTRTDVAIEVGRPLDVKVEQEVTWWIYPASDSKTCSVKFMEGKVASDPLKCDDSPKSKELAAKNSFRLTKMNSEVEYQRRVNRYCGVKPPAKQGCRISEICVNGGWEEICQPQ